MSVNPGFGGQHFIESVLPKIQRARDLIDRTGSPALLEVDGGVKIENAGSIVGAGADILVAGSAIFCGDDYKATISAMRRAGQAGAAEERPPSSAAARPR
jgi:ribulose-phosphate 3-epimerase